MGVKTLDYWEWGPTEVVPLRVSPNHSPTPTVVQCPRMVLSQSDPPKKSVGDEDLG